MTDAVTDPAASVPSRRGTLLLHVVGGVLVPICLAAGVFELHRALSGHVLGWAYAVEWPVIAGYGVHVWVRLVRDRRREPGSAAAEVPPERVVQPPAGPPDEELLAWRTYVENLRAHDPPGGPGRR